MCVEIDIRKDEIKERKADPQGRIKLPSSKYAGKILEVVVLGTQDPEEEDDRR